VELALAPVGVAIALAGCGGSSGTTGIRTTASAAASSPTTTAPAATVAVANTTHGPALVGSGGRALYLFEKDAGTASTCSGACAAAWPPLVASAAATAGTGVVAARLGTTKRADGLTQVTYNG
jgi:predicted lipoprotein with Yx(FWY)xxD motif